jgi:hypothetical protein
MWLEVIKSGKYAVSFRLPWHLPPGDYNLWVHAGAGGALGWGGPVALKVEPTPLPSRLSTAASTASIAGRQVRSGAPGFEIQKALDDLAARGGGAIHLEAGVFPLSETLRIPQGVTLVGAGREGTTRGCRGETARWRGWLETMPGFET